MSDIAEGHLARLAGLDIAIPRPPLICSPRRGSSTGRAGAIDVRHALLCAPPLPKRCEALYLGGSWVRVHPCWITYYQVLATLQRRPGTFTSEDLALGLVLEYRDLRYVSHLNSVHPRLTSETVHSLSHREPG